MANDVSFLSSSEGFGSTLSSGFGAKNTWSLAYFFMQHIGSNPEYGAAGHVRVKRGR